MISTTRSIVLNHLRYGDSSLIVNMYTESMGRQTVFIKGAFNKKSPVRAAMFQPLHLLEIDLHHRANRQMQRISNVQMSCQLQNIPFDPVKNCIALFIAEILCKTLKEEEANPSLFNFLFHAIHALDLNDCGTANFHLVFLVHYSRYLGFHAASSPLAENDRLMKQLLEMSFDCLDSLPLSHLQRNDLTEYLLEYYAMHLDHLGKLKSFPVLQNVFQD
jgi:DNA repair protein RecO (recombination protein O)